ncbi:MAG: asparaginase [Clostridia bacterium]|nr:asparaginase [Clostridia bacterium]
MENAVVEVYRGNIVESKHHVHLIIVNGAGEVMASWGNPNYVTYWRSAAKPFQVVPLLAAGGQEQFSFADEEIALMAASHGGEKEHLQVLQNILQKIELPGKIDKFPPAHNPCSGKHAAMLALGKIHGLDINHYWLIHHPIQQEMLEIVANCTGVAKEQIIIGNDGCGVPVFGMPLANMAKAYARLSTPQLAAGPKQAKGLEQVLKAMTNKPFYVAGTNRLDTMIMEITKGKLVAKQGAEGVYCVGVVNRGIGIALKVEDGNYRAIDPVIINVLHRQGFLNQGEYNKLFPRAEPVVKNHRGDIVGMIKANIP